MNQCFLFASRGDDGWLSRGCVAPGVFEPAWVRVFISHFPCPLLSALVSALSGAALAKLKQYTSIPLHPKMWQVSLCLSFPIVRMHPPEQVCCQGASPLLSSPPRSGEPKGHYRAEGQRQISNQGHRNTLIWANPDSSMGFPGGSDCKKSACNAGDLGSIPWVGKIHWRRAQQPNPVFLLEESPRTEEPGGL